MSAASSLCLLHLEDNGADAELIHQALLEEWPGCRILRVQTEAEFVSALRQRAFDLILSDFSLPGFNGLDALGLARQLQAQTPFLFLSGTIGEDNAIEALKRGATDYVIKDRMRRLVPAIRRALEEVEAQHSRQLAQQQLREQAALLDKARDAIYVCDLADRLLYWNRSTERIYGYAAAEMEGRNAADLGILPHQAEAYVEARHLLLEHGEWTGEFRAVDRAGQEFDLMARWTLVRDERGEPHSILRIDTDITEQKKLETKFLRAQRLESVGMLAGGIAHDLNNVLAPILMAVGLLQQKSTDAEMSHLLTVLETSANHGAGLVRQVLAFARGSEGERVALQPHLIIRDVVELLAETLPRSIAVEADLPKDLWLVRSNSTQLSQVVMNLCVNARDAMPDGGRLAIRLQNVLVDAALARANPGAQPGPHVRIQVVDTGSGIAPEALDRIFDPFFTTKGTGQGTGLGLSTVLGIVKSHGGFLQVLSERGRGTEFSLYFPASLSAEAAPAGPTGKRPTLGRGETILIIEDEASVRAVVHDLLKASGYTVITAPDGRTGLEIYARRTVHIHAVLTDMMMPTMQGPEVIRRLRALNPEVRIVAMSGMMEENMAGPPEPGRLAYVQKPMTGTDLVRALQGVLPGAPRGA